MGPSSFKLSLLNQIFSERVIEPIVSSRAILTHVDWSNESSFECCFPKCSNSLFAVVKWRERGDERCQVASRARSLSRLVCPQLVSIVPSCRIPSIQGARFWLKIAHTSGAAAVYFDPPCTKSCQARKADVPPDAHHILRPQKRYTTNRVRARTSGVPSQSSPYPSKQAPSGPPKPKPSQDPALVQ